MNEINDGTAPHRLRRCVECGRPYRGGLKAPALLELALDELRDGGLVDEHVRDLLRVRHLLRRAGGRVDEAISAAADRLAAGGA